MACMGPSWDKSLSKKITEDILEMLNIKYRLWNAGLDKENNKLAFDNELKQKLLEVITQIVESDAINGF